MKLFLLTAVDDSETLITLIAAQNKEEADKRLKEIYDEESYLGGWATEVREVDGYNVRLTKPITVEEFVSSIGKDNYFTD